VPFQALALAEQGLKAARVRVESLICPGLGHGIDEAGLKRGGAFLRQIFANAGH
jgi:phospholipase/carboxylesterase